MNYLHHREYEGAVDALHRYFDFSVSLQQGGGEGGISGVLGGSAADLSSGSASGGMGRAGKRGGSMAQYVGDMLI
jgi:hypothetical protein